MADDKTLRAPRPNTANAPFPAVRLKGALAAGAVTANGVVLYEVIPVGGSTRLAVRIKTTGNGGAIEVLFVGPDFPPKQSVAYASLAGTIYTTGNPSSVPVVAATEARIATDCAGENYAIIKFTGSGGAGVISYCDVSQVPA